MATRIEIPTLPWAIVASRFCSTSPKTFVQSPQRLITFPSLDIPFHSIVFGVQFAFSSCILDKPQSLLSKLSSLKKMISIVIPSIIWECKCYNLLLYCTMLTIVVVNANSGQPALNYSRMLTKLNVDLLGKNSKETTHHKNILSNQSAVAVFGHLRLQIFLASTRFRHCAKGLMSLL